MKKAILIVLTMMFFYQPVDSAEKIRIGFPEFNSSTFTLPLANIRGYFQEEGLQAELIRPPTRMSNFWLREGSRRALPP